jgi:hypothetical protein
MESHTHEGVSKPCHVMTGVDVSTVELREGHFACLTLSRPDLPAGCVLIMDRDEMESTMGMLQRAMEDADLLDAGQAPIHTTGEVGRTKH